MMKTISVPELQDLLAGGGVDLVDVREPGEWSLGHIPGARLVPLAQLRADPQGALPRDHIVFVCAKGGRSAAAAQLAASIGKQQVASLDGGTLGWASAGLALVVPEPQPAKAAGAAALPAASESALGSEPALDALVAVNLRRFRTDQGWNLDDLARESGVSRALLGQIELGRAIPSIGIVWKLAQTLGMPFSALLSTEERGGTAVSKRAAARRLLSADGRFSSRALFPLGDSHAPEFYELWLAPHSREDAEAHRPGTRENLVVTAGQLELHIGREKHLLGVGDAIVFTADVPHSYVNLGRDECWMYLVMHYPKV